jgi:transcriptional regulator with AAA-type ATPase domain
MAWNSPSPLLALTIVWHPDPGRIGEQFFVTETDAQFPLTRFTPTFCRPDGSGAPLLYAGISRQAVTIRRRADAVELQVPESRMTVQLNGQTVAGVQELGNETISEGVMLGLGQAVLLCLHWANSLPDHAGLPGLIGVSSAVVRMRALIRIVSTTSLPVLLLGETGCGKEVAARAIHALSGRAGKPMVAVNMATLSDGLAAAELFGAAKGAYTGAQQARGGWFAEARDGSLFLDEIGNAPAAVQPMLLRVLEDGSYRPVGAQGDVTSDARIISATDQDLGAAGFNKALLRRLEGCVIHLPPLRARREDIGLLILHFLAGQTTGGARPADLPFEFVSACATFDWPGNIRQLMHVLNRALLAVQMGERPDLAMLVRTPPPAVPASDGTVGARPAAARPGLISEEALLQALDKQGWQIQATALELGISRPSLYKLLETHPQIRRPEQIARGDLELAWQESEGVIPVCAARLRTPAEGLRRYLRALGILASATGRP